jgi:ABC-type iron transport system FetAB permease component
MPEGQGALPLEAWQLGLAAGLVLVAGLVSMALRAGIERQLLESE